MLKDNKHHKLSDTSFMSRCYIQSRIQPLKQPTDKYEDSRYHEDCREKEKSGRPRNAGKQRPRTKSQQQRPGNIHDKPYGYKPGCRNVAFFVLGFSAWCFHAHIISYCCFYNEYFINVHRVPVRRVAAVLRKRRCLFLR